MRSSSIPSTEADHLIRWCRAEDILIGILQRLYFNMTYTGCYVCRKSFSIQRKNMDSILLLMTTDGEGKLRYRNKEYRLLPGSIMLIDSMNPHEYHALCDGWTFKYLHFQGAMSKEYQSYIETRFGPVFQLDRTDFSEAEMRLDAMYQAASEEAVLDYTEISGNIYTLLLLFLSAENTVGITQKSTTAIQQAAVYIVENYNRNISTQEIADAVFLSRPYMCELFTKTYGMSPHEYLVMYRLSHVRKKLLHTETSISEIAEQTGFRDIFTLSRVFKSKFGLSPSEYRKQMLD